MIKSLRGGIPPDPMSTVSDSNQPVPKVESMDMKPGQKKTVPVHTSLVSGTTVTVLSPNTCFSFLKHDSSLWKWEGGLEAGRTHFSLSLWLLRKQWQSLDKPADFHSNDGSAYNSHVKHFAMVPSSWGQEKGDREQVELGFSQATKAVSKWPKQMNEMRWDKRPEVSFKGLELHYDLFFFFISSWSCLRKSGRSICPNF